MVQQDQSFTARNNSATYTVLTLSTRLHFYKKIQQFFHWKCCILQRSHERMFFPFTIILTSSSIGSSITYRKYYHNIRFLICLCSLIITSFSNAIHWAAIGHCTVWRIKKRKAIHTDNIMDALNNYYYYIK